MAKFWDIVKEAEQLDIDVVWSEVRGSWMFRDQKTGTHLAGMTKWGKQWRGYNGAERFTGQKGNVADWCLDRAVNGPKV